MSPPSHSLLTLSRSLSHCPIRSINPRPSTSSSLPFQPGQPFSFSSPSFPSFSLLFSSRHDSITFKQTLDTLYTTHSIRLHVRLRLTVALCTAQRVTALATHAASPPQLEDSKLIHAPIVTAVDAQGSCIYRPTQLLKYTTLLQVRSLFFPLYSLVVLLLSRSSYVGTVYPGPRRRLPALWCLAATASSRHCTLHCCLDVFRESDRVPYRPCRLHLDAATPLSTFQLSSIDLAHDGQVDAFSRLQRAVTDLPRRTI